VLDNVTHLPGAKFNLFSLSKMMRHGGWKLHGDKEAIWIEKDGVEIRFDIIIPTPRGALHCMYYKRQAEVAMRAEEIAMSAVDQDVKMSVMKVQDLQGHYSDDKARLEAKSTIGVVLGPRLPCEACAKTKANAHTRKKRQPERVTEKNVPMIEHRARKKVPMIEHGATEHVPSEHKAQQRVRAREKRVPMREHNAAAKRKNRLAHRCRALMSRAHKPKASVKREQKHGEAGPVNVRTEMNPKRANRSQCAVHAVRARGRSQTASQGRGRS
jgi:hypothetical protein